MPMPRCRAGTCCMARPPMRMEPAVGVSKPASIIRQVVFPEPDGPSRVRNSPLRICRSRSRTTRVRPSKLLLTPSNSTYASRLGDPAPGSPTGCRARTVSSLVWMASSISFRPECLTRLSQNEVP